MAKNAPTAAELADDLMGILGKGGEVEIAGWLDSTYPPLNEIMTGNPDRGFPFGRIVEIYGVSGSGKSWLANQLMIEAQRQGGVALLMDHEYAANIEHSVQQGLNPEAPYFLKREPDTLEQSIDQACEYVEKVRRSGFIDPKAPIVVVFDSIHAMVPKEKWEKESSMDYNMRDSLALAKALSAAMSKCNQRSAKMNACFIFLNQVREKPGVVYGDPITTPGGKTMEFYASIRLSLGKKMVKEDIGNGKEVTGQIVGVRCEKTRFRAPKQETDLILSFTPDGRMEFDRVSSLLAVLIQAGKIPYSKPRVTWTDGKQYFVKALVEKIKAENLYDELRRMYGCTMGVPPTGPGAGTM